MHKKEEGEKTVDSTASEKENETLKFVVTGDNMTIRVERDGQGCKYFHISYFKKRRRKNEPKIECNNEGAFFNVVSEKK